MPENEGKSIKITTLPYWLGYILLVSVFSFNDVLSISPTITWVLGYLILLITVKGKNPFDPQAWMFFAWGILFVNVFSGVLYIPPSVHFFQPMMYILSILATFHGGFYAGTSKRFRFDNAQVQMFLTLKLPQRRQNLITILGVVAIFGAAMIAYDIFFVHGFSLNGGDRRNQLQQTDFSPLTTVGMILLGGCYISALSLFFGGNTRNKFMAIFSLAALALSSMALAGKQGILIAILISFFGFIIARYFKVTLKTPIVVKGLLIGVFCAFVFYIVSLSSERHQNVASGQLFTEASNLNKSFIREMGFLPSGITNVFAEFFGYYGDQLGTFAERWELDRYASRYSIIELPPRVLNPFTWLERQIIKVLPGYSELYPDQNWINYVNSQTNGHYGLANWQTTIQQGLRIFGFLGQLIVVYLHGFFSRRLFESVGRKITFTTLHMSLLNNIFMFYTIMMNFLGETSAFFYLVILMVLYLNKNKNKRRATTQYDNIHNTLHNENEVVRL